MHFRFACADCPGRGFCGSTRVSPQGGKAARSAVARLGLATPEAESRESTSEEVLRRVKDMAGEVSTGAALPDTVVKHAAVQVLAALAATAAPLAAKADDVPALQSMGTPQMQMQQPGGGGFARVSGRVTYSRLVSSNSWMRVL